MRTHTQHLPPGLISHVASVTKNTAKHTQRDTLQGNIDKKEPQGILGLPVLEGRSNPTPRVPAASLCP